MDLCSIIIVTHNNLHYTKQCLESIIRITDYHPYELILVDAHSTDGTLEYLNSKPEVKLVKLEKNYPYSYSLNKGIQVAKGEYLCFMNNDTIAVEPKWLKILIECLEKDVKIGIAGPRLCNEDLSITRTREHKLIEGNQLPRYILPDGRHVPIWSPDNTITPCTYVVGACFVIRHKLIDVVGLFDEGFFFSYDETDYCVRTWEAGKKVVCNTWAKVVHLGFKTTKAVTDKDYDYDIHNYEDPEKRFYGKHTSKDFEMILRQAKGSARFWVWKILYNTDRFFGLIRQGIATIREEGFRISVSRMAHYLFHGRKDRRT